MTTDERLDRLTERHEALTQTVEVIAGRQRENDKQISELAVFIRPLSEIALRHDNRLDEREDRLDKFEGGGQ